MLQMSRGTTREWISKEMTRIWSLLAPIDSPVCGVYTKEYHVILEPKPTIRQGDI